MGIATGRFLIDTHVHAQRHAFKFKDKGIKPDFATLSDGMPNAVVYDNSPRLIYDMQRYGVDMCVLIPAFGMTDELNVEIVVKNPDRFIALCRATEYLKRVDNSELTWSVKDYCTALDEQLSSGRFKGIGESLPVNPRPGKPFVWEERFEEICHIMEVAQKYKVPVGYHTGILSGYGGAKKGLTGIGQTHTDRFNPLLAHDIAAAYPDVPLVLSHGGMQGWWSEMYMDQCFQVAAAHPNVYLETGLYWAKLYEKPLRDPNIGAERLIWGTDWGASIPQQWTPGFYPSSYPDQCRNQGLPAHQVDVYGWSLRQLDKAVDMLDLPQDDLNLVLGGNAVKLYNLQDRMPHTRLFKQFIT